MANKSYNDRALSEPSENVLPKPQIEIIVDGASIFKPGMKTYFVDDYKESDKAPNTYVVGTYCSCDTVVSSHLICTCESVSACSCDTHKSSNSGGSTCACVPVSGGGGGTGGGGTGGGGCSCQHVSCGAPCACIPVRI